jgi:hypothetical protein
MAVFTGGKDKNFGENLNLIFLGRKHYLGLFNAFRFANINKPIS